ncbi:MAG: hypothetical protein FJY54_05670 [Betaproteobacteria bacterium]|nr:hypothetical protein [Betaproteobacteria bacterium]
MNPVLIRGFILAAEILTFLVVTVAGANFISHAAAEHFGESDPPGQEFPVLVFEGDRGRPEEKQYSVITWNEWQSAAGRRPNASLLAPERSRSLQLADGARAKFTVVESGDTQQTIELNWASGEREQVAIYTARSREITPRYLRKSGTNTFLLAALLGFFTGMMTGKALRRSLLPPRGPYLPPK